jgi:ribosomal protein S15P/S13E
LELIKEYSKIIELNDFNSSQKDLNNLTKKVNNLEGINF